MRSIVFLALATVTLRVAPAEPAPPVALPFTEQRSITSREIGQMFDLLVRLPDDYATSGESYPVLYVLDGWHFPFLAFLANNNHYSEKMRPVIMVNLSYPAGVNPMVPRARDFTPTNVVEREANSGGAPAFLKFLADEVIPYVDKTYRTIPTDRGLLGHSYGGLFALYALVERPGLFQRIVAASPTVTWDNRYLFDRVRATLKKFATPVRLDLSAADANDVSGVPDFAKLLDEMDTGKLVHRFTIYPGQNHNSIRTLSFPAGLYWVYADK
jgi:predicted alpha/beta superfamily hydrolase